MFSDATKGQTRERVYPFIQLLLTGLMTRRSANEERRGRLKRARKRAHWEPTKYLAVCSKHFLDEDYSIMFSDLAEVYFQRRLLELKLVSLDDILNGCDYYVFFELNKRSFNKILNAENT